MSLTDLSNRAVLVSLTVSIYRAEKTDHAIADGINRQYNTKRNAGKYKKLLMNKEATKHYHRRKYDIEKYYKEMSCPWDERQRIQPSVFYEEFNEKMQQDLFPKFWGSVDEFIAVFPSLLYEAEQELGPALFNRGDYPAITDIRSKFDISFTTDPVPAAGDFRVSWSESELERVKNELNERNQVTLAASMNSVRKRMFLVVKDMTERIYKPGFRQTMTGNIKALLDLIPALNLADDPELEVMGKEINDRLLKYSHQELKDSEEKREEIAGAANNLMRRLRLDL